MSTQPVVSPDPASVLIIGNGKSALQCSHTLIERGNGRFRIAGVVKPDEIGPLLHPEHTSGDVRHVRVPKRVVVALDDRRGALPIDDLVRLRFMGIKVQDASDFLEEFTETVPVRSIRPADLVFAAGFLHPSWQLALKFCAEWILSLLLLIVVLPIIGLCCAGIFLESGRPLFFRQVRVGRHGRPCKVTKLRTMVQNAEAKGPQFAQKDDPRVTRFGKFLRNTRLDELPQLFNVLTGQMALIGPRPERPEFVTGFDNLIPYFTLRHSVRPGITGWAQIKYGYTDNVDGAREKLSYDLYYIKHMSPLFDLRVLLETVKTVLLGRGR